MTKHALKGIGQVQRSTLRQVAVILLFFLSLSFAALKLVRAEQPGDSAEITIKPGQCVALNQGQVCYQNTVISWQTETSGRYCVYWELSEAPLKCWDQRRAGTLDYDFKSAQSAIFSLRNMGDGKKVAQIQLTVAWVYKSRKRQRLNWRLF